MSKLRICIVATLLSASLICTVLALSPAQEKAAKKCGDQFFDDWEYCNQQKRFTSEQCRDLAGVGYKRCMKDAGLREYSPPKVPRPPPPGPNKGPENPPSNRPPGPTPGPNKLPENPPSNRPPRPSPGQVSSGPTATPTPSTIYSKPKPSPSPSPKRDHHKG